MGRDITKVARAAAQALSLRGYDSLDDLGAVEQARFARGLNIPLAELRGSLSDGRRSAPSKPGRGGPLAAEREREILELRAGPNTDPLLEEMLRDEHLWSEVTRAARAMRVPVTGARSATYGHVSRSLRRLRRSWLEHDPAVSDDTNKWVRRTSRRIRDAEKAHRDASMIKSEAIVGLERQAAAVLGAARMGGR